MAKEQEVGEFAYFFHTHTHPSCSLSMPFKMLQPLISAEPIFQSLKKETATHSSILAWKIPWTQEPGSLQSMGSPRVGHN